MGIIKDIQCDLKGLSFAYYRNIKKTKSEDMRNSMCFPVLFASDDEDFNLFLSPTSVSSLKLARAPVVSTVDNCQVSLEYNEGVSWC